MSSCICSVSQFQLLSIRKLLKGLVSGHQSIFWRFIKRVWQVQNLNFSHWNFEDAVVGSVFVLWGCKLIPPCSVYGKASRGSLLNRGKNEKKKKNKVGKGETAIQRLLPRKTLWTGNSMRLGLTMRYNLLPPALRSFDLSNFRTKDHSMKEFFDAEGQIEVGGCTT